MNWRIVILLFMVAILTSSCSSTIPAIGETSTYDQGYSIRKIQFRSDSLDKMMNMNIFLPQGYSSHEKYSVLYLLHGAGGNEDSWIKDMEVDKQASTLIADQQMDPVIIVMPNYDNSYGTNYSSQTHSEHGRDYGMYEDYLTKDVISYVDMHYQTLQSPEGRYIGGLSMGGFAALHIAFNHQDMFSKVGGHSPAMFLDATTDLKWLFDNEQMRESTDPIYIARAKDIGQLDIYLDHGDRDMGHVMDSTKRLHTILKEKSAHVQYHIFGGEHNGSYWRANTQSYLKFYADK
jgi:enterochelin esterase-like enzyme